MKTRKHGREHVCRASDRLKQSRLLRQQELSASASFWLPEAIWMQMILKSNAWWHNTSPETPRAEPLWVDASALSTFSPLKGGSWLLFERVWFTHQAPFSCYLQAAHFFNEDVFCNLFALWQGRIHTATGYLLEHVA